MLETDNTQLLRKAGALPLRVMVSDPPLRPAQGLAPSVPAGPCAPCCSPLLHPYTSPVSHCKSARGPYFTVAHALLVSLLQLTLQLTLQQRLRSLLTRPDARTE